MPQWSGSLYRSICYNHFQCHDESESFVIHLYYRCKERRRSGLIGMDSYLFSIQYNSTTKRGHLTTFNTKWHSNQTPSSLHHFYNTNCTWKVPNIRIQALHQSQWNKPDISIFSKQVHLVPDSNRNLTKACYFLKSSDRIRITHIIIVKWLLMM